MSMGGVLILILVLAAVVEGLRRYQMYREQPQQNSEPFDGEVYRVGEAHVSVRRSEKAPAYTVIAMHGFLEDHRYFMDLYSDPACELILLTSADYHPPVAGLAPTSPAWARPPSHPVATIAYDADVLNQVLEHLPTTDRIRLHGHSRGGAVVIDAANQRQELHCDSSRQVECVLEAPVLPQAEPHRALKRSFNPVARWLLPFTMPLIKRIPFDTYARKVFGKVSGRKRELLSQMFFNPKRYATLLTNAADINDWMAGTGLYEYRACAPGYILVGEEERILHRASMLASAQEAGEHLKVVEMPGTTHFITQDRPEDIPPPFASAK